MVISWLVFSFVRFSYVFSLCFGPGVFLRAIFLCIQSMSRTWHIPSRDFLRHPGCVSDLAFCFARISNFQTLYSPPRDFLTRNGCARPQYFWAFRRIRAENVHVLERLGAYIIYIFERFGALVPKMLRFCILLWAIVFACIQCFRRGISLRAIFFARGTWKLNHVLLVLWLYEMFCV